MNPKHGTGWVGLTASILDNSPALPDAACADRSFLFDPQRPYETDDDFKSRSVMARNVCATCPERRDCIDWVRTLKRDRVSGILPVNIRRTA